MGIETWNNDRQANQPTNQSTDRRTWGVIGKFHFQEVTKSTIINVTINGVLSHFRVCIQAYKLWYGIYICIMWIASKKHFPMFCHNLRMDKEDKSICMCMFSLIQLAQLTIFPIVLYSQSGFKFVSNFLTFWARALWWYICTYRGSNNYQSYAFKANTYLYTGVYGQMKYKSIYIYVGAPTAEIYKHINIEAPTATKVTHLKQTKTSTAVNGQMKYISIYI